MAVNSNGSYLFPCVFDSDCFAPGTNTKYLCIPAWVPSDLKGCTVSGKYTLYVGAAKNFKTTRANTGKSSPIPSGWGPDFPVLTNTKLSKVPYSKCVCLMPVSPVDPVYASARLVPGSGIGYKRSKVIICNTDNMDTRQPGKTECPNRTSEYIIHINRLTESFPRRGTTSWKKPRL